MLPDDVRHGTYAGATQHIRDGEAICEPCKEGRRRMNRRYAKNRRRGWKGRVEAGPTRRRLIRMRAAGMTFQDIATVTGIGSGAAHRILSGDTVLVLASTAAKVAMADPGERPESAWVPVFRVRRRMEALQALGWSLKTIADKTGWSRQNLGSLMTSDWRNREQVARTTFEKIDTVYRELCMLPAPDDRWSRALHTRATRKGFLPPLAWTDIDDPNERPTNWAYRAPELAERAELIADLDERHARLSEACDVLNLSRDALERWCDRNGMRDVFVRLRGREDKGKEAAA